MHSWTQRTSRTIFPPFPTYCLNKFWPDVLCGLTAERKIQRERKPQDIQWHTENVLNATVSCRDCPSVFLECVKRVIKFHKPNDIISWYRRHTWMSWYTNSLSSTSFSTNIERGKPNEGSRKICLWTFWLSLWKSGPCCCCDTEDACASRRLERAGAMGLASTWDYLWGRRPWVVGVQYTHD